LAATGSSTFPVTAPWLAEYLHEMTVFPNGKHDDQVDSTPQFLHYKQKGGSSISSSPAAGAEQTPRISAPICSVNGTTST